MPAKPRVKKRGANENVTAGGKKPKKEEEPKPFVCAIYRRDIASFLPRVKVQEWRLTSSHSNASLIEFPSRLSRFKYDRLTVIFASSDRCILKKNGFLDRNVNGAWAWGKEFNSIYKFRFCCRDVRNSASALVGQRLFPKKPDNEGVVFQLFVPRSVVCCVPNLLTKKTASAILHFLHHISQASYEHVEIVSGATADAAECVFNPIAMQVLPKFRLRGVKFGPTGYRGEGELSNLTAKMASEMRIHYNFLFYYSNPIGPNLPLLLDFIANGRQLKKRLELLGIIRSEDVDQIIKYFEQDIHNLEEAIRDVRYESTGMSFHRPGRCPREAAVQVTRNGDGTVDYCFDYTNAHSKEPFSLLLLGTRRHEGRTLIRKFHLTFGSA